MASTWKNNLEINTVGSQYLLIRAAIDYNENGVASVVAMNDAKPTKVVRDIFEYVRYSNKVSEKYVVKPNVPYSRTAEITLGYDVLYSLDVPNLTNLSMNKVALYETTSDNAELIRCPEDGTGNWYVETKGNKLYVALKADPELLSRVLKIFIYYDESHKNDEPNSYDKNNVAFILTIKPVLFKVTGFELPGYNSNVIHVNSIDEFMTEISSSNRTFVPVYEYSADLLDPDNYTNNGKTLATMLQDFTEDFLTSSYVSKTRTYDATTGAYYFQVVTSVAYEAYHGIAYLTNDPACRIWQSFTVLPTGAVLSGSHETHQAVGTEKTYHLSNSALEDDLNNMFAVDNEHYNVD